MIDLPWDPELDSPATIAVIGGGPIGIEAAIYARFLGYFVSIFESRRVAHRMLDWNDRLLSIPVSECTSSLGLAAIKSQDPEFPIPAPETVWTGKQYAEEYLLPLAKTDLLFDDIHFLSPVTNISRLRTHRYTEVNLQDRCEDEFRIVVAGRHRGTWISRADIVLDCRGRFEETCGIGPGGGYAIGELEHRSEFYAYSPLHRKFEPRHLKGKHVSVVGTSLHACRFVQEFLQWFQPEFESRLTWIYPSDEELTHPLLTRTLADVALSKISEIQTYPLVGVEKVSKLESGKWQLTFLVDDNSTVDFSCDLIASFPEARETGCLGEVDSHTQPANLDEDWNLVTNEPGYYRLNAGEVQWDDTEQQWLAGHGISRGLQEIRKVFTLIGARESLDLYKVMADNLAEGRL